MLGDSLSATKTAGEAKLAQPADDVDAALVQHVRDQLDRGVSLDALAKQLADALATQVANLLGVSPQAAHDRLTQLFGQALTGGGAGPPGETNAQRATALVATLRRIAEAATRVTNADPGTPIRMIAGQRSDADTAKASPTPDPTDRLLRGALDALAAPASSAVTAAAPAPGDGRTVALEPAQAVGAGGDTLLGRTLSRAVLADQQRSAPANAVAAAPAAPAGTAPNAAVEAFVRAFTAALAQGDAGSSGSGSGDGLPSFAAPLRAPAPARTPDQPASPFALAVGLQHAGPVEPALPALPAATVPQTPPVDPNAVIDQMLRGMQVRTADGQSEVRLRLVPEQLGDVSVKLVVSGGSVDATITANSAAARDALAGGQSQLARTLADAGLKLQSFSVGLAGGGLAGDRDGSSSDRWARQAPRRIGAAGAADGDSPDGSGDEPGLLAVPSFGPPLFTASSDYGYNYLV